MTLDELRERIKDEVVLHEGDVADYQWRQLGLTDEATKLGLSGPDFGRLVNQISLTVAPNLSRIAELRSTVLKLAQQRLNRLTDTDLQQITQEAERAHLTRSFVVDTWLPTLLKQAPVLSEPVSPPPVVNPPVPPGETADTVRQKVTDILSDYDGHIPALALRSLFRSISYDENELSTAIWNYLQIHQYAADHEPQGTTLRDKLLSTDWRYRIIPTKPVSPPELPPVVRSFTATPARVQKGQPVTLAWEVENLLAVTIDDLGEGLSPKNRGWVKPTKTADYTLFDANNNPLSTVRVEVIKPDRSGVYGVLFALALLTIIYWFIKSSNARESKPIPERRTGQTTKPKTASTSRRERETPTEEATTEATDPPVETRSQPAATSSDKAENDAPVTVRQPADEPVAQAVPEPKPATPADARQGKYEEAFGGKPYDKIELGTDQRGWRRARSKGRWGYVNEADEWVIQPEYEAVTPFRGNTAAVFLNGQLMTINRAGEQVRN